MEINPQHPVDGSSSSQVERPLISFIIFGKEWTGLNSHIQQTAIIPGFSRWKSESHGQGRMWCFPSSYDPVNLTRPCKECSQKVPHHREGCPRFMETWNKWTKALSKYIKFRWLGFQESKKARKKSKPPPKFFQSVV